MVIKKGKAIPVTGHEGAWGCETSRLSHFLDNRLIDGGEVVSPTRPPSFTHRKIPGTHFCYRLSRPQGHSAAGRIRSIDKSNDLIRIWLLYVGKYLSGNFSIERILNVIQIALQVFKISSMLNWMYL
jgi:hypothetical protein